MCYYKKDAGNTVGWPCVRRGKSKENRNKIGVYSYSQNVKWNLLGHKNMESMLGDFATPMITLNVVEH